MALDDINGSPIATQLENWCMEINISNPTGVPQDIICGAILPMNRIVRPRGSVVCEIQNPVKVHTGAIQGGFTS